MEAETGIGIGIGKKETGTEISEADLCRLRRTKGPESHNTEAGGRLHSFWRQHRLKERA